MKTHSTRLIIGNWKMNPQSEASAVSLYKDIARTSAKRKGVSLAIAAPFVFIPALAHSDKKKSIVLCAQDASAEPSGAHTGSISLPMLKSYGVSMVIIGHSERRAAGETDEQVEQKAKAALKAGMAAVVCVGERARDKQGDYFGFVQGQVRSVLHELPKAHLRRLTIAYEPIWAIGTGNTATPEDVQEMKLFIQKCIADSCGRAAVSQVKIIYGGSVDPENALSLLEAGNADGFLVGGASLKAAAFNRIIEISSTYATA